MNDATLASIRKLKDNNGAYIWQPFLTRKENLTEFLAMLFTLLLSHLQM